MPESRKVTGAYPSALLKRSRGAFFITALWTTALWGNIDNQNYQDRIEKIYRSY